MKKVLNNHISVSYGCTKLSIINKRFLRSRISRYSSLDPGVKTGFQIAMIAHDRLGMRLVLKLNR